MEWILGGLGGLLCGALLGYFFAEARLRSRVATLEAHVQERDEARQRLESEARDLRQRLDTARADGQRELAELREAFERRLGEERQIAESRRDALTAQASDLRAALAEEQARRQESEQAAEKRLSELKNLHEQLVTTFKALSSDALRHNNTAFLEQARQVFANLQDGAKGDLEKRQQAIGELVKPLQERLQQVDTHLRDLEQKRAGAYEGLQVQVRQMMDIQGRLQGETANLVQALRRPQVRGRWGELQLRRVVELAGMAEHVDFLEQESSSSDEGTLRADLIIRLPNGRQIVVDAKCPLDAYLSALEATEEVDRAAHLLRHARQVKERVRGLSSKKYWEQYTPTPDFAVLFLPGESFFSAALENDRDLLDFGAGGNVLIATPTTLIALLKAVAYGWRQERATADAERIATLGLDLYKRLATLGEHVVKLGRSLGASVEAYNKAVASLDSRVMTSARRLSELAPSGTNDIPELPALDLHPAAPRSVGLGDNG